MGGGVAAAAPHVLAVVPFRGPHARATRPSDEDVPRVSDIPILPELGELGRDIAFVMLHLSRLGRTGGTLAHP